MADETIQDTIETLAKDGFASTSFSQGSTSQSAKSLPELIEADRYLKGEAANRDAAAGSSSARSNLPGTQ